MLFLSIHPEFVDAIVRGDKTVELRKRRPRAQLGSAVVIYATTPRCEVVATALLDEIKVESPARLWNLVRDACYVTRQRYNQYYQHTEIAVGLVLTHVEPFKKPIPLSDLRKSWAKFQPPQQFLYLSSRQQKLIQSQESSQR